MRVVWDVRKAAANLRKHEVELSHASTALEDPAALTVEDKRHEERRFVTLGADIVGRILVVVYAYDDEDTIRLISARKATVKERRAYEQKR